MMMTRKDLAGLSAKLESELVLSVYLAREHEDPGMGEAWRRRLAAALGNVRSDIESNAPQYLAAFQRASEWVMSELDGVGRVLPHEGWCAFATVDRAWHSEGLPFRPPEMVRWRQGLYTAPYVRVFKSARPVVLGLMDRWHAQIFRFQDDELSMDAELEVDRMLSDAADVGVPKRASGTSGMRGTTGTDFAQRSLAEEVKRLRTRVVETIEEMCGDDGGVVVGGTREAGAAARKELEERLPGRVVEVSELSFDTSRDDLVVALRRASSLLTLARQSRFLDSCGDPGRGSHGWNETYRALAAGAVDTLLVSRDMIAAAPDDADRLIRLALTQGAEVEEVGAELGSRLMSDGGGVAARLRFLPASLQA
jgi:hypothetical protein